MNFMVILRFYCLKTKVILNDTGATIPLRLTFPHAAESKHHSKTKMRNTGIFVKWVPIEMYTRSKMVLQNFTGIH